MLWMENDLYVRIVEMENGPMPRPLSSGFSSQRAYRVLGCFNPSETSDAYMIMSNDRNEIWFICNRHLRIISNSDAKPLFYDISEGDSLRLIKR